MWEKRIVPVKFNELEVELWINPPRGDYEDCPSDTKLVELCLVSWNLGGKAYQDYTFPKSPNSEAIRKLPFDIVTLLAFEIAKAIKSNIPKLKGTAS
ncbi:MAG: hypothetical protein JW953_01550 [Anaerolineae bacterium]|nr:hypothetical protein [Anaerolineae bacterium]